MIHRGIDIISYDYGHHPNNVSMGMRHIRYDYTPDGRKLSTSHATTISKRITNVTTDTYIDGLILRNGKPQMWQFGGGYVELDDNGTPTSWNYYITDHLGSTRMVVDSNNNIKETINYYPFGSEMRMSNPYQIIRKNSKMNLETAGFTMPADSAVNIKELGIMMPIDSVAKGNEPALAYEDYWQRYRFSGKELDKQNGLNMYDFGARLFDVAGVPMWTSVDPLAEKNYPYSPYSYCAGDPVNKIDPDGRDDYYTTSGEFIKRDDKKTDHIIIRDQAQYEMKSMTGAEWISPDTPIEDADISAEAYSKIFTNILSKMEDVDVGELHNGKVSVTVWENSNDNLGICTKERYNDAGKDWGTLAETGILKSNGDRIVSLYMFPKGTEERAILNTVANIQNLLGAHEFLGHYKNRWSDHSKVVPFQRKHSTWNKTTKEFKDYNYKVYGK